MLRWLRETMGGSAAGVNAMFGALEEIFNPAAAQARKEQHERVIPIPSPGDKLLAEGKVMIPRTPKAQPRPRSPRQRNPPKRSLPRSRRRRSTSRPESARRRSLS
jgi:hypothetical protein